MKIGIVGLGQMGLSFLMEASKYADSIVCYDIDTSKLANIESTLSAHKNVFNKDSAGKIDLGKIKCHFNETDFLDESSDVVIIATHKETHAYYAISAMEAGSNVLIEKPVCCSLEEAEAIRVVSDKLRRKAYIGFSLHGTPAFMELKRLVKNNIGKIKEYKVKRLGVVPKDYPAHVTADFDLLSHDTDLCLQMFGEPHSCSTKIISERECIKSWNYPNLSVSMHGILPVQHTPEFQYSFTLLCEDDTRYDFDSTAPRTIHIRQACGTQDHINLLTDTSSCALILESVIDSINDDYDQFLRHHLSIKNGYRCMKWLAA